MLLSTPLPHCKHQQGSTLIEVLIAIVIFSCGILGLIGLQANMTRAASDAKYRAEAGFIAQQRISAIWLDPASAPNFGETDTDISTSTGLPGGLRTTQRGGPECNNNLSCFLVKVEWQQPGSNERHSVTMIAHVVGNS